MKATTRLSAAVLALVTTLSACGGGSSDQGQPPLDTTPTTTIAPLSTSVASYVASSPDLSTLAELLDLAGLTKTLAGKGTFTLLAPTNEAFANLGAGILDGYKADKAKLKKMLLNHVLDTELMSIDILEGSTPAVSGRELAFVPGDPTTVEGIEIAKVDTRVENGVIHQISGVIVD